MTTTAQAMKELLELPTRNASDVIYDDVCELEGVLSLLMDLSCRDKEHSDLYWMFSALNGPVTRLKEALNMFDEYGYARPNPKPKLESVPKGKASKENACKPKPSKRQEGE